MNIGQGEARKLSIVLESTRQNALQYTCAFLSLCIGTKDMDY
jgi:hypothetical protein